MLNKLKNVILLLIIAVWALFFIKALIAVDTDFGWHLKVGELMLTQGIPAADPFSYTMPNYQFIDHEWLTDVGIAEIFPSTGFWGLALIFTVLAIASILLVINLRSIKTFGIPVLMTSLILLFFGGSRPQVITWFFLALILWIIFRSENWDKLKYWLPLLFLIWANLHGGFVAGLVVLGVVTTCRLIQTRNFKLSDWMILIASILVSLINPYGLDLWKEIFVSLNDSHLRLAINEWSPAFFRFDLVFISLLALSIFLTFRVRKKLSLAEIILYLFFTISALSSNRNIPLWALFVLFLTFKFLPQILDSLPKGPTAENAFQRVYLGAFVFTIFATGFSLFDSVSGILKFRVNNYYPVEALTFIKNNQVRHELFAPYTWGGYLIWQLPEYKVYIDGRMPSWENARIMKEYEDLLNNRIGFEEIAHKYQIRAILWDAQDNYSFLSLLDRDIWKEIYRDQTSVIYEKIP